MTTPIDREAFRRILGAVLAARGIDPDGTGWVPIAEMAGIARDVREGFDRAGLAMTVGQLHEALELLKPELLDRSMIADSLRLAVSEMGKGLGLSVVRPS